MENFKSMRNIMNDVGIKNLKAHTSSIVRSVWKKKSSYVVTYHGRPVGLLSPIAQMGVQKQSRGKTAWDRLEQLGSKISSAWNANETSLEILSGMRR
jgi:prevent-host-death family protein